MHCCTSLAYSLPGHNSLSRPKSLLVSSPSTKLLSLEEAQARTQAQINSPVTEDSKYIEVGEGPAALQGKFHTVIEFPTERFVNSSSCDYYKILILELISINILYCCKNMHFNVSWTSVIILLECAALCWLLIRLHGYLICSHRLVFRHSLVSNFGKSEYCLITHRV